MPKKQAISFVVLALFVFLAFGSVDDKKGTTSSSPSGALKIVKKEKVYIKEDCAAVAHVFGLSSKVTDLQKKEAWKEFEGKWVNWTAKVTSVDETFGTLQLQVKCQRSTFISDAIVSFGDEWRSDLLNLRKGQKVNFEAQLEDYNAFIGISLKHGSILK